MLAWFTKKHWFILAILCISAVIIALVILSRRDTSPMGMFVPFSWPNDSLGKQVLEFVAKDGDGDSHPLNPGFRAGGDTLQPGQPVVLDGPIASQGNTLNVFRVPLYLVTTLPITHPAYYRYELQGGPSYSYRVEERNGKLVIIERPDLVKVDEAKQIAWATGVKAKEIAIQKLQTLDRYNHWQEEGWEYTVIMTLDIERSTRSKAIWLMYFDTIRATDQAIWMTVDTGKGVVTKLEEADA